MKPLAYFVLALAAPLLLESETQAATRPAAPARDTTARAQLLASALTPESASLALVPWMRASLNLVGASGETRFSPPRVDQGPEVDGVLDDDVWSRAAVLRSFTHTRPVEGVRDSLGTVALVLYDDHNLYVAFHAGDDPRKVQAPVVPRDQIGQGDWVGISIDTYHDHQRSFFLCSNPLGIQMDGIDQEGRDSDMAPDFQYSSRGRVTTDGYDVEMAIPFKTLRFIPGEKVEFGFQAIRDVRRDGTHMYWAPVSRDINSYHTQIGTLENLEHVRPGRNVEVNPTHSTTTLGQRTGDRLRFEEPQGSFGLGVKVGITSNLTADATMTPDFSQIEADAGVLDINERFALFFDEKRPFFLEGSDIFSSPINLVYTRRIVDPLYGAKLTGKVGHTSIGFLNAADRSTTHGVEGLPNAVNPYAGHQALYTIARFKRDVLKNSYLGFLAGDRTHHDQYNRGLGLDGRLSWRDRYSLSFQGAQSWVRDPDYRGAISRLSPAAQADVPDEVRAHTGANTQGNAWRAELSRDTRKLNVGMRALSFSPDFAADMGFVNRLDQLGVSGWLRPHLWAKPNQWFTGFHAPLYYERIYSHGGDRLTDEAFSTVQEIDLPRNSELGMENVRRFIRHNGVDFTNLNRHAMWAESGRYRAVRPGGLFVWGDQVVFAETVRGHDQRWELWSDFRFGSQFDGSLFVTGSTVWRDAADARFAQALIQRLRLSYQFNKELSVRWITERRQRKSYDTLGSATGKTQTLTPDVLISYYVRPGTVVYLGYGSILAGNEMRDLTPARSSVFTKLSYLWQM